MDLVKRYIAAVQRELPEAKRDEIGRELQANIMDQLDAQAEQHGGELSEQQLSKVLIAMGHPRHIARQFCPPAPLIPVHFMPLYKHTMFMVLGVLFVLQVVFMTKIWLTGSDLGLLLFLKGLASGFIQDGVFAFTAVTVGFAVAFHGNQPTACQADKQWQPQQLPAVGAGWQHISLDDIFTDLATYAFLLLIIWLPLWQQWFGGVEPISSIFSPGVLKLLLWFSPIIVLGVLSSLWQLTRRIWSLRMLQLNIAVNLAFVVILLLLASGGPLFQLNTESWSRYFNPESFLLSVRVTLVIIALFPAYEVVRDLLRLRRLA
ncbi:hypothetical protein [Arsukibacterium sp.]|uniref:hypothetical protein n=1 Tax=Arsukibacterium sp. TaxID=1977258 RepID=UPI002FD94DA9